MLMTYNRMYVSADTVVDFFPFFPFGHWVLDAELGTGRGRLMNGVSLRDVQVIWGAVAAAVWIATFALYRRMTDVIWRP
jgi:hypothetical protein